MAQLRLLACFAHPDDEAFTASGYWQPVLPVGCRYAWCVPRVVRKAIFVNQGSPSARP
jgi:hypothetical protein